MKITTLMLGELASNCYIQEVGNKKCVIVDIGGDAPIVFRRLEMMQLEPVAILLTHGHYDHIAGVDQVREKYQIPVYVHSLDANMLTDSRANLGDWLSTQPFQPVQEWKTVEDGDTLQFGDNTFTVIHTPAYTGQRLPAKRRCAVHRRHTVPDVPWQNGFSRRQRCTDAGIFPETESAGRRFSGIAGA